MFQWIRTINIENYEFNIILFRFINEHHSLFFDNFFLYARFLGRGEVILLILVMLLISKRSADFSKLLISSVLTAFLVVLFKFLFAAPRPALLLNDVHLLLPYYKNSFPSGDAAVASLILVFFFKRAKIVYRFLLIVYWLTISYGRIYLGVHFPIDIIGGFFIAFLCILVTPPLAYKLSELLNCNKQKRLI